MNVLRVFFIGRGRIYTSVSVLCLPHALIVVGVVVIYVKVGVAYYVCRLCICSAVCLTILLLLVVLCIQI